MYTYHVLLLMHKNLNNVVPDVLFNFQMNILSILILHAKIVSSMLPTVMYYVEHVPGNALSTIRAQQISNGLPQDMKTLRFSLFKRSIKNYILNQ